MLIESLCLNCSFLFFIHSLNFYHISLLLTGGSQQWIQACGILGPGGGEARRGGRLHEWCPPDRRSGVGPRHGSIHHRGDSSLMSHGHVLNLVEHHQYDGHQRDEMDQHGEEQNRHRSDGHLRGALELHGGQ